MPIYPNPADAGKQLSTKVYTDQLCTSLAPITTVAGAPIAGSLLVAVNNRWPMFQSASQGPLYYRRPDGTVGSFYPVASVTDGINRAITQGGATLDLSSFVYGGVFPILLNANVTSLLLPPQPTDTLREFNLTLTQGAGGSKTVAWTGLVSNAATPPVLSTAAGAIDKVQIIQDGVRNEVRLIAKGLA